MMIMGTAIALVLIIMLVTAFNRSANIMNYIIPQAFATTITRATTPTNYTQSKNTTDLNITQPSSSSILGNSDGEIINATYTMKGNSDSLRTLEPNLITLIIGDINKAVPIVPGTINDSVKAKATIINQITKKTQAIDGIYTIKGMVALEISRAIKTRTEISNSSDTTPDSSIIIETKIGCGRSAFSSKIIECNDTTRIHT
jgi:hypothetical protein